MAEKRNYIRFAISQIIEHWVMAVAFVTLAITGLPQKFVGNGWAETMIAAMGGIETVRIIHHTAAIVMVLAGIYHIIVVSYKIFVLRVRWTMFPRLEDVYDALDLVRFNLGLTNEHPKYDHFSFAEKTEYWAMVWGTVIMAATGFIMWNPINAARFLSGDMIPASKAAHGAEAILAVLAIVVWHFYNVHVKTLNRTVFTGKLTADQMHEEHALELARLEQGKRELRPSPDVLKKRERLFIPIATVAGVLMLVMVFFLTTYETTAITTLPHRATVVVFVPLTPTPVGGARVSVQLAPNMPTDHTGRTECLSCHANMPNPALPADHKGRVDATCSGCHLPAGSAPPAAMPADHAGRTTCLACHAALTQPKLPADHAARQDSTCTTCHPLSQAPAGGTPAPTSGAAATGPAAQPADHAGRTTCLACHASLPDPKLPADHQGRTDATCAGCHPLTTTAPAGATTAPTSGATPAATSGATAAATSAATAAATSAAASGPSAQPADHAGRTTCLACHAALPQPKLPADHQGRTDATCAGCHPLGAAAPAGATAAPTTGATPAATSGATPAPTTGAAATGPAAQPADHAGRTACLACHAALAQPKLPADHQGRTDATCAGCHPLGAAAPAGATAAATKAASTSVATAPATTAATAPATTSAATPPSTSSGTLGMGNPLPADHAGRTTCLACHASLTQPKLPADHQGRQDSTCVVCHKLSTDAPATSAPTAAATKSAASATGAATAAATAPATKAPTAAATSGSSGPSAQPADHVTRTYCVACHSVLTTPVLPADHQGRTDAMCAACHKAP